MSKASRRRSGILRLGLEAVGARARAGLERAFCARALIAAGQPRPKEVADLDVREGELDRTLALGGDDPEPAPCSFSRTSTSTIPEKLSSCSCSGSLCSR